MRKANGILIFGILFLVFCVVFIWLNPYKQMPDPSLEAIMNREKEVAFIKTTFWSGIILIIISIYFRLKVKRETK